MLELIWEVFVEIHVQSHLLLILGENVAGEEDIERIVDASTQVLDAFAVVFLLQTVLFVECGILTAEARLLNGRLQKVQSLRLGVRDVVTDLLVGGAALLKQDCEDFL